MNATTTNRTIARVLLAMTLLLATAAAAADRTIDETRQVSASAEISIENLAGSVEVIGWDRSEVQITGTLDAKADELKIEGGGSELSIEVRYPHRRNLNVDEGSRLTIKVPHGAILEIETVSAEVDVNGVRGDVGAETVSGNVTVRGEPRSLEVETVSGTIDVETAGGPAALASVSGDIIARGVGDELDAATVSGAVEISAAKPIKDLSCESVSGKLEIAATPAPDGRWDLSCHSGLIDLEVPADVDAAFEIETFSGDIRDGFGHEAERTSKYAPGRELDFVQGRGSARIAIECFSGDVAIRKR